MKKHLQRMLLLVALMVPWSMSAQMPFEDYTLTTGNGTFNSIVSTGTSMSFTSTDDGEATCTLPFAFHFGESTIASGSTIACSSNGYIFLGMTGATSTTTSYSSTSYRSINPLINQDAHMGRNTGAGAYYKYDATAGTFTIEYHLLGLYSATSSTYGRFSYQVVLHQGSDVIDIIYDLVNPESTSPTYRVFLNDGPNNDRFYISGTWANPVLNYGGTSASTMPNSSLPTSGLRYTFSPVVFSCPRVINLTAFNVDTASFDISWSDTAASSWIVSLNSDTTFTLTDTFYSFTGLTPNTTYAVSVTPLCTGDDTGRTSSVSVTTPCAYLTELPYVQTFEGVPSGSSVPFPSCMYRLNNGTTYGYYPYVSNSTTYNHTPGGSQGLYWYNTTTTGTYGDYQVVVLPGLDSAVIPLSSTTLSFWARSSSSSYYPVLYVGVMTNPNDLNTFQQVATVNVGNSTAWQNYEVDLADFTGPGRYIAIRANRGTTSWYVYVDDIRLDLTPTCAHPTNLVFSGVTHEEFTATWQGDPTNASAYLVRLDTVGGTMDEQVVYDTTVTYTMLDAGREYTLYIYSLCNMGDTTREESGTVTTMCVPIDSLPVHYDFEDAVTGSSNVATFAPCLVRLNNGSMYFGYPYVGGSSYNHTPGGSKGLYWYNTTTTGTYGDYQIIVLPAVDESVYSVNALELLFWARSSSTSYSPVFQVGVMDDPYDASTFTQLGTINVGNNTNWAEYSMGLASYTGTGKHVAIRALRPTSSWYAYFDDITLRVAPSCPDIVTIDAPTVATTGAVVNWTVRTGLSGTPDSYEIEVTPEDPSESTLSLTSTEPQILITGLTPGNTYYVNVRVDCGVDGYSPWSDTLEISTVSLPCGQFNLDSSLTVNFSNGTSTNSGTLVYSGWGNTVCQNIYTAAELTAAGLTAGFITAIDLGFSSNSSYAKELTIFMGNTTQSSFSSSTNLINPATMTQVYGPAAHPINTPAGFNHYNFTQPFYWDGTSNIVVCNFMNQPAGASHSSSGFSGYYTSGPNASMVYRYQDSNPFTLSNYTGGSGGSTSTYRASIHFYREVCDVYATCVAPTLFLDSVVATDVTISWIAGNDETSWDLSYRVAGSSTWVSEGSESNTSHTFTGLNPATTYEFRVSTDCGDNTYQSSTIEATTECVPMSVPYYQDFETFVSGSANPFPVCWAKYSNYSTGYPYASSTSYNHSFNGTGIAIYMYSGSGTHSYMVLPTFDLPIDSTVVSFWLYKTNTSYAHAVSVGVMEDPADFTTYTEVAQVAPSQVSTWEGFEVSLASYTGNGRHIALVSPDNSYSYPYLDDLSVDRLVDCQRPSGIVISNVAGNSADMEWNSTGAYEYEISYGPAGFTPGFGMSATGLTDTTYSFTGLASNTTYTVYVRGICGDTSAWSFARTFTTTCGTIMLPFTEDFESRATTSSSSSTFIPCWGHLNNGTSYMGYPYLSSSTTYNHTENGTKGLYWYGSTTTGTYGDYYYIVLPPLDTTVNPVNSVRVKFWAKASGTSYHPIVRVGVMTDPTNVSTFQPVDANIAINPGSSTAWAEFTVALDTFTGYGSYIAIGALRPSSTWYMYMDDITVEAIPDCPDVTAVTASNITTTDATLNWTENGNAAYWDIEYGPQGFVRGTGTTESVYTLPHTITGLNANTVYTVYISPECSGTAPVTAINFRTECASMTSLPYTYGFEGLNTTSSTDHPVIPCWHHLNNGTSYPGYPYVTSTYHTGTRSLYWYASTTTGTYGDYEIVVLPAVDANVYPINTLQLKFWARASSTSYNPDFQVGVMTDPNDATTFQQVGTVNVGNSAQWQEYTMGFANYTGSGEYIALRALRGGWYAYTDDFTIEEAPTCPPVINVTASQMGTTGALLTWGIQPGLSGTPDSYEITATPATPGATAINVTSYVSQVLLTGLMPGTEYSVTVRADCGSDGYGAWSTPLVIHTLSLPCIVSDTTTSQTVVYSTGTTQTNGIFVNSGWGNTFCQAIYTAADLNAAGVHAGRIKGVRLGYSSAGSYTKELTIYMGNTTLTSFSSASNMVSPTTMTQVYGPTVHSTSGTSGWIDYTFTTPFVWDGTSNIILSTFMNQSGSSQSSSGFYAYSTDAGRSGASVYRYMDSSPFTAGSCTTEGNTGSPSTYLPSISFVTDGCSQTGTCAAPLVIVDSVLATEVGISWAAGNDETSWEIEYRQGTSGNWTYESTETVMNYNITGLTPATTYQIRVTASCSDTDMASIITVTTPCVPFAVPFTEDFESFNTGSSSPVPQCWYKNSNYSTGYPYISTSYSHNGGSKAMYMYSGSGTYSYLVLPQFDLAIDSTTVSFWLYKTNTSYTHAISVGVMTDPADFSTYTEVAQAVPTQLSTWEPFEINLASYTGTGRYIALVSPTSSYCYPYLDDLTVERTSPCPRVGNVGTRHITQSDATVYWTPTTADEYEVQYGPAGFALGTGIIVSSILDDTVSLTGLAGNTPYDVYVRGICNATDTGNWSFRTQFRTACILIDSLPFIEDFESQATGSSTTGSAFIPCWTRINNGTSSGGYPYVSSSTTYNHTSGGSKGLYWYGSTTTGSYGDYYYIVLPQIDTLALPINTLQLSFWARSSSTSYYPVFQVGVMRNNSATDTTFEVLQTINVGGNTEWVEHVVALNNHVGGGDRVAIRALRPTSYWYAYMDDISLDLIPLCPRVEDLHVTVATLDSITIVWQDTSSTNTSWVVEYDTVPFTPGLGLVTTNTVTDTFFIMTGLDSGTTYHVYVYPYCNGDVYYRHITATTLAAGPAYVPYFCGFDGESGQAWDLVNGTQVNRWCLGTATSVGTADSSALYISTDNGATHTYNTGASSITYAYRTFRLSAGEYGLSFDWHCAGEGEEDDYAYDFFRPFIAPAGLQLTAGYAPNGYTSESYEFAEQTLPTGCIELSDYQYVYAWVGQTAWSHYSGTFTVPTDGVYKLVFAWADDASAGDNPPAAVDNVTLVQNICPTVSNLAVNNIRCDSALVTWNTSAEHSGFLLEYDTVTFLPGNAAFSMSVSDSSALLTGLDTGMSYYVYVSSICSGDTGMAVGISFTTLAGLPATVPYYCNFEGAGNNRWEFANENQTNYWMVGSGTGHPGKSLYITNDGSSNNYNISSTSDVYAYRVFNLTDTGEYAYSFDWQSYGESCCDYLRAALMPVTFNPVGGNSTFAQATGTPIPGAVADLTNAARLNITTGWQTQVGSFRINTPGIYKMVFYWHNDGSIGTMPPAAIDNVSLIRNTCPMVQNVSAAVSADSINLTWTAGGSELEWEVTLGTTSVIVYSPNYTFTGLTGNANYTVTIRAICGPDDTSMYYSETYHTPCSYVAVPYSQNFDALTSGTMPSCWQYILTNASYSSSSYYPGAYSSSTYAHSGSYSLRLYGVGYHMLPPMAVPLDSLQLSFWNYTTSTSYGLEVGVMEGNTFVPIQDVTPTSSSTHVQTTVYFGSYTGNSRIIAFRNYYTTSTTTGYSYNYIDDVVVDYLPTCPPVVGIISTGATTSTIDVDWTDQAVASAWQIEYGPAGHTFGGAAATRMVVTSHPVTITGLDTLTPYDIYVRPICSATDTGAWSNVATLMTAMCGNAHIVSTTTPSSTTGTTYYYPVNNYYNYTLSETIIDSAEIGGPMDIEYLAYYYDHTAAVTEKSNCTVYFQPTRKTAFSGTTDIVAVDSTAVRMYVGDFNFTQGWNYLNLDTVYHYDGTGNLLVIVDDNSGDYNSSGYNYRTQSCSGYKTIVYYSDSYNPDAHSASALASYSGTKVYYQARVDMQLLSCNAVATCRVPVITSTTGDYQSATMTWSGNGTAYEVAIKAVSEPAWPAETAVTGNTYTFTGLQPATAYQLRVRQDCSVDSLGYSDWAMTTFVTDSLPCLAPDSVTVSGLTNATGTFAWTVQGNETAWDLHVWNTTFDTVYTHVTNPVTVGGFTAGVTYNAAVRALCGTAQNIEGEWSDTVQFTTAVCATATGLTAGNVTYNSVTLTWNAVPGAIGYSIMVSSGQTSDSVPMVTSTSYVYTGLESETQYHFYVRTICGTGWRSETAAEVYATTADEPDSTFTITAVANNATYGYVTGGGSYQAGDVATLTATAYTGYSFSQWNDGVTTNPRSVTVTGDATYTAIFTVNQYTVTVNSANPTMGSVSGGGSYAYNSTATLTATANPGYHFTQWNDGDTHAVRVITVTSDTVFTAAFAVDRYTVTVTSNNPAWGSVSGGGEYDYNATATLTATPNANYYFIRWSDGNTSNPRSLLVTGDITLEAIFSDTASSGQTYTLTLSVNDPAMGSLSTYGGTYAENTPVPVSATANAGYHFVNWSDNSTENPRTFVMTSDITMTANFAQDIDSTAVLTVSVNGNGFVTVNGAETSTYRGRLGDVVTLVATAYEGNVFAGWSDGSTEATRSYTLTENNATLTANFTVGIAEVGVGSAAMAIYPNPAKGSTTVSVTGLSGKVRIAVLDLSGREVLGETVECGAECEKSLDIEGLAGGAYFVRVTSEAGAPMVKKLIVR